MKNHLFRRTRQRQEIRLRILDAARELFVTHGEAAVTLRKVARMIEYSATTIYLYFPDKRTLLDELCAVDFAAYSTAFKQAERLPDTEERLRQTLLGYVAFGVEHPHHYRTMFISTVGSSGEGMDPKRSPEDGAGQTGHASIQEAPVPSPSVYDYLYTATFTALAAGKLRPDLIDSHQITQTLWSGIHGIVSLSFVRAAYPKVPWRTADSNASAAVICLLRGVLREG